MRKEPTKEPALKKSKKVDYVGRYKMIVKSAELRNYLIQIRRQAKLKVLVFGPGKSGGKFYIKRCEIRDAIRKSGYDADFPEETYQQGIHADGINATLLEFVAAVKIYDYVVCLMESPGSIGEVHDFGKFPDIERKMMICVRSEYKKSGYSGGGTLRIFEGGNGKVDWFEYPKDLVECNLKGRVMDQIQKVAEKKQFEIASRGMMP